MKRIINKILKFVWLVFLVDFILSFMDFVFYKIGFNDNRMSDLPLFTYSLFLTIIVKIYTWSEDNKGDLK